VLFRKTHKKPARPTPYAGPKRPRPHPLYPVRIRNEVIISTINYFMRDLLTKPKTKRGTMNKRIFWWTVAIILYDFLLAPKPRKETPSSNVDIQESVPESRLRSRAVKKEKQKRYSPFLSLNDQYRGPRLPWTKHIPKQSDTKRKYT
jgi:hypothetical protein